MFKILSERPWISWFLAGILISALGIQVRLYPLHHNVSSDSYEEGTMLVIAKLRAIITTQVNAQAPNMSGDQKAALITAKVNEIMRKNKDKVLKAFDDAGDQLQRKASDQKRYLQESDSYYFLSLTRNVIEKGRLGPRTAGGTYFNDLMLAPLGFWQPITWHPYVGAAVYKIMRLVNPKIDLMEGVSWTPIFLLPLVVAAFLFACRAMGCSLPAAFTSGMFFIFARIYLQRSTYAWYDDDTYAVLFPAVVLACFFLALRHADQLKKILFYGSLCAISAALYSKFWPGWGYLWGLTIASTILIAGKEALFKEKRLPRLGLFLTLLAVVPPLTLTAMIGLPQLFETVRVAWGELEKFSASRLNGWPDLFVVVGELKKGNLKDIITFAGGAIPFIGAISAFLWAGRDLIRQRKAPSDTIVTLSLFFAATFVLSLGAQRFAMLSIVPVALLFAYSLERLWQSRLWITERMKLPPSRAKWITAGLCTVCILSTLIPLFDSSRVVRSLLTPIFNSAWDRALTQLRTDSPPESIVNTWWSPGHFVKAIAQRRVNFDGASINGEQGYWMTRVYLAQDEREALGILRMANTSSNKAATYLQDLGLPLSSAVPLLREITKVKRATAEQALLKAMPAKNVRELLRLTHGERSGPPPSYVLVYQEIVDGNILLGYVGKWDFAKIEKLNQHTETFKKLPKKSSPDFVNFLWSLAGGPYKQSSPLNLAGKKGTQMMFEGGISVDTADMSARVDSDRFGRGIPASIVYFDDAACHVVEKRLPAGGLSYSIVFYYEDGAPKIVLADQVIANSLLFKMYYFEGKGLNYFKPFAKERDLTGRTRIYIYEVSWPKDF